MNKPKKRDPLKTWENKCDIMFSKVIRKRGYCEWPKEEQRRIAKEAKEHRKLMEQLRTPIITSDNEDIMV